MVTDAPVGPLRWTWLLTLFMAGLAGLLGLLRQDLLTLALAALLLILAAWIYQRSRIGVGVAGVIFAFLTLGNARLYLQGQRLGSLAFAGLFGAAAYGALQALRGA